jgi:hypothetical protein
MEKGIKKVRVMKLQKIAVVVVLAALFVIQNASAQTLFTTTDDFGLFEGGAAVVNTAYYSVNDTVNGLGNAANAGGAGGIGSLQLTASGGWSGWISGSSSPGQEANQASLSALDPGAIAAWSAGSGYGPGTLLANSGTITMDVYGGNFTDWNWWGVTFNYNGHWDPFFASTSSNFTGADGRDWTHYVIPYTLSNVPAGLSYFQMAIAQNAGAIGGQTFYVDNIQVTPVPEPGTFALLGLGVLSLFFVVRRRVS